MDHKNPTTIRRAHSFDSADNLERWQAIRDHRKQFLSMRAKFEKVPPTEPPPPPPRQESKRTMFFNRSGSVFSTATSTEGRTYYFNDKQKSFGTESYQRDVNNSFSKTNSEPKRSNSFQNYLSDRTNKYPQTEKLVVKMKMSESQKSYIELKQSWIQFKDGNNQVQGDEAVDEPLAVKKKVDHLGYEIPTSYQEFGVEAKKLDYPADKSGEDISTVDSYTSEIEKYEREVEISNETGNEYYLKRPSDYYNVSRVTLENKNFGEPSDISLLTSKHQDNGQPNQTQEEKKNLDSNWKIFTDGLLDAIDSTSANHSEDKSVSDNAKPVVSGRPRRVSTESVHDPIVWRSLYPSTPVKTMVQKFSKK